MYATSRSLEGLGHLAPPLLSQDDTTRAHPQQGDISPLPHGNRVCLTTDVREPLLQSEHALNAPFSHWYLSSLGVDAAHQGKGYASALLKSMLGRLDRDGVPCYLETQREVNVRLYGRYGFNVTKEGRIPGTPISTWAMLREPSR